MSGHCKSAMHRAVRRLGRLPAVSDATLTERDGRRCIAVTLPHRQTTPDSVLWAALCLGLNPVPDHSGTREAPTTLTVVLR